VLGWKLHGYLLLLLLLPQHLHAARRACCCCLCDYYHPWCRQEIATVGLCCHRQLRSWLGADGVDPWTVQLWTKGMTCLVINGPVVLTC
jgi:hypothetical protein